MRQENTESVMSNPVKKSRTPGRNAKCPCGSGLKAKKCCLTKIKLYNSMSPEERKKFYTESLFMANRIKEQIAKQQAKLQSTVADTTSNSAGEISDMAPIYI
jgi:hypothetical protein